MLAALLENTIRQEATQAKVIDPLVVDTFDNGKTVILELGDKDNPNDYRSSVYFRGILRVVKRMTEGRVRRIQIEF